ncbi:MAG: MBL fold metallo-hydrolase [Chitinophagaceae bacterium]
MKILPLSEGSFTVNQTKKFIPFQSGHDHMEDRPVGSLLVEIQPFLVITSRDYILLDTGLGFKSGEGTLQIHSNLIKQGIHPQDITKVLLSHLHQDHAGGISISNALTGEKTLSFPQATYYVNRQELNDGLLQDGKSYFADQFRILQETDQVQLLDGNGTIDGYIHYELTGGHCPYHQVFLIEEGGEKIFFGGDVAPQISQMKSRIIAKYDDDGKRSMELRQQFLQRGIQEGWIFLYYHDTRFPFGPWGAL